MNQLSQRTKRDYSDDLLNRVDEIEQKHNESKSWEHGYYIIDTTGEYQVYYTLYRYTKQVGNGMINPYTYIKNISIDLEKAIADINKLPLPVRICSNSNNDPIAIAFRKRTKEGIPQITFGKHAGMTIAEIWDIDRNWVMWFYKNYKQTNGMMSTYVDFRGNRKSNTFTDVESEMMKQCKVLIDLFFEDLTEKNKVSCTSQYIGTIKQRMDLEATITFIKKGEDFTIISLISNGNLCYIYDKDYNLEVGAKINMKCTPVKHFEKVGKKTTYLNRISIY